MNTPTTATQPQPSRAEAALDKTINAIDQALQLCEDPNDPESKKRIAAIRALYRVSMTAENSLSFGEAMSPAVRARFYLFCGRNGFDPTGSEVFVLGGRPYVSLDGRLARAHGDRDSKNAKTFKGFEVDRPMTREERETFCVEDGVFAWISIVRRSDCEFAFNGYGFAGGKNERNPVFRGDPVGGAQKRARERALKLAYPRDCSVDEGVIKDAEVVSIDSVPVDPQAAAQAQQIEDEQARARANLIRKAAELRVRVPQEQYAQAMTEAGFESVEQATTQQLDVFVGLLEAVAAGKAGA